MSNPLVARYKVMKKLPVLLCLFLLSACAPSEVPSDRIVERNGIKYEINSQRPFTGVLTEYHRNGQLSYSVTYKDGEAHGHLERYHKNGQLWLKKSYKDGEGHGLFERYYENGQLELKSNHKDGAEHGLSETYKENGQEQDFSPMCYQNGNQVDMSKCK